jgi:Tfp pilus assembly protein PilN
MKSAFKVPWLKAKPPTILLGIAFDGARLDGVVVQRTDAGLKTLQAFSVALTLDPLSAAPELAGREIRNQLDAVGVHERRCVVGLPLKWILTTHTELPPLPEEDAASLLQLEAERGFSSDVAGLQIGESRSVLSGDRKLVLFAGIPRTQLDALEQVLAAAKLKPFSFMLGISALQPPVPNGGVMALVIGENTVSLQVTVGGGIAALRALEGAIENENGRRTLLTAIIAREARVTLGQLPEDLRAVVKHIRIFGPRELAQPLADELELRFEPMGLSVEMVTDYAPKEFGGTAIPGKPPVSAAFSLAARALTTPQPPFEFLPPKPSALEEYVAKYTSGRLGTSGAVAAAVAVLVALLFLVQQIELLHYRNQWSKMSGKVAELQDIQDHIQQFRPWYDTTFRSLAILRQLTLAFPEDGSVTAKTIEIRDGNEINLTGTARDNAALLAMQARLRAADGVSEVKVDQIRGKAPIQFTFDFQFGNGGVNAN